MSSTQRQVGDVLSELARDNYRGLIDPHTYRLQRAQLLDQLVDDDDEEASSTTRPQAPGRDRRTGNPPLSDPANQRRRDVDRVREQIETAEVLEIVDAARRQARDAANAASAATEESAQTSGTASTAPPASPPAPPTAPRSTPSSDTAPASTGGLRTPLIAGLVAAIVVIGSIVVMLSGGDEEPVAAGQAPDAALQETPGERLLGEFMDANDWSDGAVSALVMNWEQLLPSQQQATLDSPAYRSIAFEVRRRLLENAALRELEGGDGDSGLVLVTLAQAMNLPVPLPDSGDNIPVAEVVPTESAPQIQSEPAPEPKPELRSEPVSEQQRVSETPAEPRKDKPPAPSTVVTADSTPAPVSEAPQSTPREAPTDGAPAAPAAPADAEEATAQAAEAPVTAPADSGCHVGLLKTRQRGCADVLQVGGEGPRMAIIRPGSFTMGSKWAPEEGPAHSVTLESPFGIAIYEVSHDEYQRYCSETGARCPDNPWSSGDYPVVNVSWEEASAYARWLSAQTGRNYRLPTEAEWEFSARAGVDSRYPFGDELLPVHARYASGLGAEEPWPRGYRDAPRNGFGLYNSIGNVREWVADAWHATHADAPADGSARDGAGARVVRGGSYADEAAALRLSSRMQLDVSARDAKTGFRIALDFQVD